MLNQASFQAAFSSLASGVHDRLSEDEVERLLEPIYQALGYRTWGRDLRGKRRGSSGIPDVLLLNNDDSVQVVVEVKRATEDLRHHEDQLIGYVRSLKAPFGLLTNGRVFWLYRRSGVAVDALGRYDTDSLARDASALASLEKQSVEPTNFAQVETHLQNAKREGLELKEVEGLPSQQFLHTFSMAPDKAGTLPDSPFAELLRATQDLLVSLEGTSGFVEGSFDFWKKVYARDLASNDAPQIWTPFLSTGAKDDLYRFMFSLETAYILVARLILAKAVQDHDRQGRIVTQHMADTLLAQLAAKRQGRDRTLPLDAYLAATEHLFNDYAKTLFTSIYAQDLFDWWRDHPAADESAKTGFATAVSRLILSLVRFDFASLEGDLLGELYQRYFDPETRKALGEFYTPPEVVNFILDEVGYEGEGRLLDPATGSGTFLIQALRRYLTAHAGRDPVETLKGLTESFQIVAFDINPFAVMMAQVNFAAHLVPLYTKAIEQDSSLVLRRLPIVRTDSLRQEIIEGEVQQAGMQYGLDFGGEEITAYIELPVKTKGEPLKVGVTFPNLESAKAQGVIRNEREWLLALQAVFAAVEKRSQAFDRGAPSNLQDDLRAEISLYQPQPDALTAYLRPYADGVWSTLENLKTHHGDGRFLKTLEDLMLGLVLKHYLSYDFVVGNPPYVRVQNLPNLQKRYWSDKYVWARGNYDIFIPFIERVLYGDRPWLREGGKLGYVVSNSFLNTESGTELRKNLPKVARINSLTDFKAVRFLDGNLFEGAMTYTCILSVTRDVKPKNNYQFRSARFYPRLVPLKKAEALQRLTQLSQNLTQKDQYLLADVTDKDYMDVFWDSSTSLSERGWYLMPPHEREVFDHLDTIGESLDANLPEKETDRKRRLANYTATESGGFAGIQTSLDSVMVLKQLDEKMVRVPTG